MERAQTLVIDASVALKWFLEEEGTIQALQLQDQLTRNILPAVPALFFYEIANVLRYKKEFGIKNVQDAMESLESFQFFIAPFQGTLISKSIEYAYTYGITIYDAVYLALSKEMQCPFITADTKLVQKIKNEHIYLLQDWISLEDNFKRS